DGVHDRLLQRQPHGEPLPVGEARPLQQADHLVDDRLHLGGRDEGVAVPVAGAAVVVRRLAAAPFGRMRTHRKPPSQPSPRRDAPPVCRPPSGAGLTVPASSVKLTFRAFPALPILHPLRRRHAGGPPCKANRTSGSRRSRSTWPTASSGCPPI